VKRDPGLGFREPVSKAEKGANLPAFIPALLDLVDARIREAECIFVGSNRVDHHVGCFHQDVFPFWLPMFEPSLSLNDANSATEARQIHAGPGRHGVILCGSNPFFAGCGLKRA
jgi:hypothetical protein